MEKEKYQELSPDEVKKFEEENMTEEQKEKSEEREAAFEAGFHRGIETAKDKIDILVEEPHHEPSSEEIQKAEDMTDGIGQDRMTKKEKIMSYERDKDHSKLSEKMIEDLKDGKFNLTYQRRGDYGVYGQKGDYERIKGTIGDHSIDIKRTLLKQGQHLSDEIRDYGLWGIIDGEKIDGFYEEGRNFNETSGHYKLLRELLDTYITVARLQDNGRRGIFGKQPSEYERIADKRNKSIIEYKKEQEKEEEVKTRDENIRSKLL